MWLVVGLGNPGTKYERNRHNVGFLAVEHIARELNASAWSKKFGGLTCEAKQSDSVKLILLKPQTYMNLSGESVGAAAQFYKIPVESIIVLHDDLDVLPGKLKVKQGGGAGGHNGLKSIDAHLGENYWRVRIGIGHPGDKDRVSEYVLSDFSKIEWSIQQKMIEEITRQFPLLIQGDTAGFINQVTQHTRD